MSFLKNNVFTLLQDVLDFKLKETTIQIKFLGPWEKVVHPLHLSNIDKTVKTFVVDESKTVGEIAKDIGTKLGLRNADELSLKRLQAEDDGIFCDCLFCFIFVTNWNLARLQYKKTTNRR